MLTGFDLHGKRALVTGSSRGIGKAIALGLASAGADVAVHCAGNVRSAEAVAEAIRAQGARALALQHNLTEPGAPDALWQAVEAAWGGLDILVLNASVQVPRPWETITPAEFDQQMHVNVLASMALMQKAAPGMRRNGWGRILTVGSVQEVKPHPDMLVYAASKAAQTMMARSLAAQLVPYGVTVNNLAPGVIMTDRNAEAYADEAYRARVTAAIPAGYWGEPEDCVGPALLLCSDAGRYITGQSLLADGGKSL